MAPVKYQSLWNAHVQFHFSPSKYPIIFQNSSFQEFKSVSINIKSLEWGEQEGAD